MATNADPQEILRERLLAVVRSMQRDTLPSLLRMQEGGDFSLTEVAVLQVLDHGRGAIRGDPTLKELATLIGRSDSRTSRLVDRMVRRGLLERYEDGADRRVRRVRLAEAGGAVVRRIAEVRVEAQTTLWAQLTHDEMETVVAAMELLAAAAHRMRSERDERGRPG
ncbi:MarR family winged helix-turn-helix transcriptional regulator [Marinactinospora rubrisoli]|uniref:MarR family winged helix-turn-helix transcriptional regulator n=1 Tax=Marinactinospora rubrisoli TaxID=2715399 RepID=A0ABW2KJ79_9ACTN